MSSLLQVYHGRNMHGRRGRVEVVSFGRHCGVTWTLPASTPVEELTTAQRAQLNAVDLVPDGWKAQTMVSVSKTVRSAGGVCLACDEECAAASYAAASDEASDEASEVEDADGNNAVCEKCGDGFYSASSKTVCPDCRENDEEASEESGEASEVEEADNAVCEKCEDAFYSASSKTVCPDCRGSDEEQKCLLCKAIFADGELPVKILVRKAQVRLKCWYRVVLLFCCVVVCFEVVLGLECALLVLLLMRLLFSSSSRSQCSVALESTLLCGEDVWFKRVTC
jgi:hypothetical protein